MGNSLSADLDGTESHGRVVEAMESKGEKSSEFKDLANPNSKSKDDGSLNSKPLQISQIPKLGNLANAVSILESK